MYEWKSAAKFIIIALSSYHIYEKIINRNILHPVLSVILFTSASSILYPLDIKYPPSKKVDLISPYKGPFYGRAYKQDNMCLTKIDRQKHFRQTQLNMTTPEGGGFKDYNKIAFQWKKNLVLFSTSSFPPKFQNLLSSHKSVSFKTTYIPAFLKPVQLAHR